MNLRPLLPRVKPETCYVDAMRRDSILCHLTNTGTVHTYLTWCDATWCNDILLKPATHFLQTMAKIDEWMKLVWNANSVQKMIYHDLWAFRKHYTLFANNDKKGTDGRYSCDSRIVRGEWFVRFVSVSQKTFLWKARCTLFIALHKQVQNYFLCKKMSFTKRDKKRSTHRSS